MPTVRYYLHHPKRQSSGIDLVFTYEQCLKKQSLKLSTGHHIDVKNWDTKSKRMKGSGAFHLNNLLNEWERVLTTQFEQQGFTERKSIKDWVLSVIKPEKEELPDFWITMQKYIDQKRHTKKRRTGQIYQTQLSDLKEFKPDCQFSDINIQLMEDFQVWCIQKGLLDGTTSDKVKRLKYMFEWARERGYHSDTSFKRVDVVSGVRSTIVVLDEEELKMLMGARLLDRHQTVRDLFLFMVFTGQRISDVRKFNKKDLVDTSYGPEWQFIPQKTEHKGKKVYVPLYGWGAGALQILEKYDYKLPLIADQNINLYIKEACQLAGIEAPVEVRYAIGGKHYTRTHPKYELISNHAGRRTCITCLLNGRMTEQDVQQITGHEDVRTLRKYYVPNPDTMRRAISALEPISLMRVANE